MGIMPILLCLISDFVPFSIFFLKKYTNIFTTFSLQKQNYCGIITEQLYAHKISMDCKRREEKTHLNPSIILLTYTELKLINQLF